jgi:hypothetical protein
LKAVFVCIVSSTAIRKHGTNTAAPVDVISKLQTTMMAANAAMGKMVGDIMPMPPELRQLVSLP